MAQVRRPALLPQAGHRGDQDGDVRILAGGGALEMEELLAGEVGAEARFGDQEVHTRQRDQVREHR